MDLKEYRIKNSNFVRHPWELARISIIKKLISKHYAGDKANILDIGTGDGYALEQIAALFKQYKGFGLDIALTEDELKTINTYFAEKNKNITITNTQAPIKVFSKENKFDIVCLMDVLEHIKDDSVFLKNSIKDYNLDKNTLFVITVPAFKKAFSNHDRFLGHYRRYTKETLSRTLKENNLEIVDIGYFFFSLLVGRFFIRIIEKIFKTNKEFENTGNWPYGNFAGKLVKKCLMLDFYVAQIIKKIGIKIPGLSVYAIVKGVSK